MILHFQLNFFKVEQCKSSLLDSMNESLPRDLNSMEDILHSGFPTRKMVSFPRLIFRIWILDAHSTCKWKKQPHFTLHQGPHFMERCNIDAILPTEKSRENNGSCALPGSQNEVQTPCYFPAPTRIYNKIYQEQAMPSICRVIVSCTLQGQSTLSAYMSQQHMWSLN